MVIQTLQRILLTALAVVGVSLASKALAQDAVPGTLHTTPFPGFASGIGKISALPFATETNYLRAMVVQPDRKIVLAGTCEIPGITANFCLARLNPNGTIDTTFDGPGPSGSGTGNGNGQFALSFGRGVNRLHAIALQVDGKILLAGMCSASDGLDSSCVVRLNTDGSLDQNFNPGSAEIGTLLFRFGQRSSVLAISAQSDGKVIVAGGCTVDVQVVHICVARLNGDGSFDPDFDGPSPDGFGVGEANGHFSFSIGTSISVAVSLVVEPDGKIVLAGDCGNDLEEREFCFARLNQNGSFDLSFVGPSAFGNGKFFVRIDNTTQKRTSSLLRQADGKLVVGGICITPETQSTFFCFARLNSEGNLDASFVGPSGNASGSAQFSPAVGDAYVTSMALQTDGKLIVAGSCDGAGGRHFCLLRMHQDGMLDVTFDGASGSGNGFVTLSIGPAGHYAYADAVAVQPDGRVVVAGSCFDGLDRTDFCVARLNGGPFASKQCSLDVDGDGRVLATTDMLVTTRIALGMTGSTVINGIQFAEHATRRTWDEIRDFLVTQCSLVIAP